MPRNGTAPVESVCPESLGPSHHGGTVSPLLVVPAPVIPPAPSSSASSTSSSSSLLSTAKGTNHHHHAHQPDNLHQSGSMTPPANANGLLLGPYAAIKSLPPSSSFSTPTMKEEADEERIELNNFSWASSIPQDEQGGLTTAAEHSNGDRRVMRRATSSTRSSTRRFVVGEPCEVCADTATGIHYGAAACNGCKTFFRRVVLENRIYSCKADGCCQIDKDMRCSCRHCRFKKCLLVGMDKTELNLERRRRRTSKLAVAQQAEAALREPDIDDPLIVALLQREDRFVRLLTSTAMPIHDSLDEALSRPDNAFGDKFPEYDAAQMDLRKACNFSYWRAKILSIHVDWARSFQLFNKLGRGDQSSLIIHSAFSCLVLSEAFHTPQPYTDRISFPDGTCGYRNLADEGLKEKSGLIPTVVAVINKILVPMRRMQMSRAEYVLLLAVLLFDSECISLTNSARQLVQEKQRRLLNSLRGYLAKKLTSSSERAFRFAQLLLRIANVQKVAAFKRETLCTIETFNLMSPHPFTMEISKKYPDVSFF